MQATDQLGYTFNHEGSNLSFFKINCVKFYKICDEQGIERYPTFRIYYHENNQSQPKSMLTSSLDSDDDIVKDVIEIGTTGKDPKVILDYLSSNYDID